MGTVIDLPAEVSEAARLAERICGPTREGGWTVRPGVHLWRLTAPQPGAPVVYPPTLCFVVQGSKRATLPGEREFIYDTGHYLVTPMTVPARSELLKASVDEPFLAIVVELDPSIVRSLLAELDDSVDPGRGPEMCAMASTPVDDDLSRTLLRFVSALGSDREWGILGSSLLRELHYRVLMGPSGHLLREAAGLDGPRSPVAQAIRYIEDHLAEPVDVAAVSRRAGLSPSALHRHFRRATGQSPIQFLKRLRLLRAHELLLGGEQVTRAALAVGYGSVSQFSREFKRYFGVPPSKAG